jgi:hypothetical protein
MTSPVMMSFLLPSNGFQQEFIHHPKSVFNMKTDEIIAELEQLLHNPMITDTQRAALEKAREAFRKNNTLEAFEHIAQFLAALAGVASYIQHLTS